MARPHARGEGVPRLSAAAARRPVRHLRGLPLPHPHLGPGASPATAATCWSARRTAAGWTRSWSCTRSRPSRGRGSSAVARRPSRRAGASGSSTRSAASFRSGAAASASTSTSPRPARSSPMARSSSRCRKAPCQRPARPPGAVPHRLGDHRAADRRPDRAARDRRHGGALPREADALAGPVRHHGAGAGRSGAGRGVPGVRAPREELALAHVMSDALAAILGPVVERLHPLTVDPPGHPKRLRAVPDLAAAATGPPGPRGLIGGAGTARRPARILAPDAVRRFDPRPGRPHAVGAHQPRDGRPGAAGSPPDRARQARDAQPGRLGEGPHRPADDRGGGA